MNKCICLIEDLCGTGQRGHWPKSDGTVPHDAYICKRDEWTTETDKHQKTKYEENDYGHGYGALLAENIRPDREWVQGD